MSVSIKVLLAVVLLFASLHVFGIYKRYPVDQFCSSVSSTDTEQSVIRRAKEEGRYFLPMSSSNESIMVFNHQAPPMWRYACVVKFDNGKVSSKRVIAAD